jgi:hypothetical protein
VPDGAPENSTQTAAPGPTPCAPRFSVVDAFLVWAVALCIMIPQWLLVIAVMIGALTVAKVDPDQLELALLVGFLVVPPLVGLGTLVGARHQHRSRTAKAVLTAGAMGASSVAVWGVLVLLMVQHAHRL